MLRLTLLTAVIVFLAGYAWRDWFKVLCALICMMAVLEHPEMPKSIMNIPGFNPWNVLMGMILMSWYAHRKKEHIEFDFPKPFGILLVLYLIIVVVGFFRGYVDQAGIIEFRLAAGAVPPTSMELLQDELINTVKWVIPGILLFTAARTPERQRMAAMAIMATTVILALQVIRWMPLGMITDGTALSDRALRVLDREIGYHRVDLAALLAGGFWAIFNFRAAVESRPMRLVFLGAAFVVLLALVLTGGRMGYVTWAALGLGFAVLKYKKYLIIGPILVVLLLALVPAAQERMMYGFNADETADEYVMRLEENARLPLQLGGIDLHAVTSGRAIGWPYVIEKILERPFIGHGQMAMQREGISLELMETFGAAEALPHPHNAYLQVVLDNGLIMAFPILLFFYLIVTRSLRPLLDKTTPFEAAIAAVALSLIGTQLIASFGSQSFYPKAGTTLMWCAIGLQLRMLADRRKRLAAQAQAESAEARPRKGLQQKAASRPVHARGVMSSK